MKIDAKRVVGTGFPPDEGKRLADELLRQQVEWRDLEIDVTGCPPALLISAFFNGFLQEVFDRNATLLDAARKVTWDLQFTFQSENVRRWMKDFKPFNKPTTAQA
jgi:hypothetical protein